jgi:N utilization substance protein A
MGRIAAQSAKQIIIQKVREAERDSLFEEYAGQKGELVTGTVTRVEGSIVIVQVGRTEALLPRSEQLPGESFHVGERTKAVVLEVRKAGQRIKIVLSRAHADFVRRLFEQSIPEIADRVIEIRSITREAGYRTKIAVTSIDSRVDPVGACVGMRGSRIKTVLDELGGERIDIIRWNDSLQVMIPNALQPAAIEEVQIYTRLGRAVVLVKDDQLSLAIGKKGQNVRLASKLCGIDIELMTIDELTLAVERAEEQFNQFPMLPEGASDRLIEEGIFSYSDVSVMEPEDVMEICGVDEDTAFDIIEFAEQMEDTVQSTGSSRSNILSGTGVTPTSGRAAAQELLGPVERIPEEKAPSVQDLFGASAVVKPEPEKKITAAELFGEGGKQTGSED